MPNPVLYIKRTDIRRSEEEIITAFEKVGWKVDMQYQNCIYRSCGRKEAVRCWITITRNGCRYQSQLDVRDDHLFFDTFSTVDRYILDTEPELLEETKVWMNLGMLVEGRHSLGEWRPGMNRPNGPNC